MERTLKLLPFGPRLWTRELARKARARVKAELEAMEEGDALVLDMKGVEAFDYSFANELFGNTILELPVSHKGRFVLVENLTPYTRENLVKALESMSLVMLERTTKGLRLIGETHPADVETFGAIAKGRTMTTAAELSRALQVNLNAMNERLSKLVDLGLVRREKVASAAGRAQFAYAVPD
jgi:STAS-like domain of unknown function (DUF4325)